MEYRTDDKDNFRLIVQLVARRRQKGNKYHTSARIFLTPGKQIRSLRFHTRMPHERGAIRESWGQGKSSC